MKVLLTTCESEQATSIVQKMLQERLVGCGNIVDGVKSMYWWKGEIQKDPEALIIMETPDELCSSAIARLTEIHPYDVPKIMALEPTDVIEAYQLWLREETGK